MDPITQQIALASAGAGVAPAAALDVEDVFSTYLYEGNATSRTITNGIDLAGEGGMVWIKNRDLISFYIIQDTERGTGNYIRTTSSTSETSSSNHVTAFNSDGFDLGTDNDVNDNGDYMASWTFRKSPGFFDVVTYTGNGVGGRTVSHNLGSVPGMIWVKRTDATGNWIVYHRSEGATKALMLNTDAASVTFNGNWNSTEPTATEFTLGANINTNGNNDTYVAYIFAHDDASFGPNADEDIIQCGSYTGNGSTAGPIIDLGWEPQWVLIKRTDNTGNWIMFDTLRGIVYDGNDNYLFADATNAEASATLLEVLPTGFQLKSTSTQINFTSSDYVYMAIRRADTAPAAGTDFFQVRTRTGTGSEIVSAIDFNADSAIIKKTDAAGNWIMSTRGFPDWGSLEPSTSDSLAITTGRVLVRGDEDSTITIGGNSTVNKSAGGFVDYIFKRARGAFDTVFYTGTNAVQAIDHGLGAVPKMIWIKCLDSGVVSFIAYHEDVGNDSGLLFNNFAANASPGYWNDTSPTSTQFTVNNSSSTNGISNGQYVAYLFGNVSGVIDIGSYTGTGAAGLQIDCGFTAGARFVLIKCTTTGTTDWNVYDTARGITIGSSPELSLNTSGSESSGTNLEPYSAGFEVNSTASDLNTSGETYIYMAIA